MVVPVRMTGTASALVVGRAPSVITVSHTVQESPHICQCLVKLPPDFGSTEPAILSDRCPLWLYGELAHRA